MKQKLIRIISMSVLFYSIDHAKAQVVWGVDNSRTETRNDAGLQGSNGAISGFFQAPDPLNFPSGASGWWHLLDVRHSNPEFNYAMQFAGGFFDQELYFRKVDNYPLSPWSKVLLETNGKVGIGTISPVGTLDVNGHVFFRTPLGGDAINITNLADQDLHVYLTPPGVPDKYSLIAPSTPTNLAFGTAGVEKARITNAGDFGIGTTNPQARLDIAGSGSHDVNLKVNGRIQTGDANNFGGIFLDEPRTLFVGQLGANMIGFYNNNGWRMVVQDNGNVGIGTSNPQAKLAVNGDIFSTKLKVTQEGWPDYVFDPGYKLLSLSKVETFIRIHKHLPQIPSASEIEKDGLDVGANQTLLLKKIEEITLYLIEQSKQQDLMKLTLLRLNSKIEKQQNIITRQSNSLKVQQQSLLRLSKQLVKKVN